MLAETDQLLGSQTPTHRLVPPSDLSEVAQAVEIAEGVGLELDPWQVDFLHDALGVRTLAGRRRWSAYEVALELSRQNGKATSADTPVLTDRGWVTMVDIQVGDRVYHPAGHMVSVEAVSDIMLGHDCYQVTTTDGRRLVADADHLWTVTDKRTRRDTTLTTRAMVEAGLDRGQPRTTVTDGKRYTTREYRWALPRQEPLKSVDVDLPVDPYLLGGWLGNGSAASAQMTIHVDDRDHWVNAISEAGFQPTIGKSIRVDYNGLTLGITATPGPGRQARSFVGRLRALGVLGNKHVPDLYLLAGTGQREALLQGLLDTDGHISRTQGQVEFTAVNRQLADSALFLARSLGWRTTLVEHRAMLNGRDMGPKYRVCFTPVRSDFADPFRLPRKADQVNDRDGGKGRHTVSIKSIDPVPTVPVRCLRVDSPDGLFLAGRDLVATHNSVLFEVRTLYGLFIVREQMIVYSAHKGDTAMDAFRRIDDLIATDPELKREVKHVYTGNGKEAIHLKSGQLVKFRTRTSGGGRGLAGDLVMVDEDQDANDDHLAALFPLMAARSMHGDPQIWYAGSAGTRKSIVEGRLVRRTMAELERLAKGLDPEDLRLMMWRFAADLDVDDPAAIETWLKTNPAVGRRISLDHIASEWRALGGPANPLKFGEERLGVGNYPRQEGEDWVLPRRRWELAEDDQSAALGPVVFAVEISYGRLSASIGVAGFRADGSKHVELVDQEHGTTWTVERLKQLTKGHDNLGVLVDPGSETNSLLGPLRDAGVEVTLMKTQDVTQAYGKFYDGVMDEQPTIRHRGGSLLTSAVAVAETRTVIGATTWKRNVGEPVAPLLAVTWAAHGLDLLQETEEEVGSARSESQGRDLNLPAGIGRSGVDIATVQW
ncbi:MAG: LAGLIDADG family homing endonuclease [Nocardioides sp.]